MSLPARPSCDARRCFSGIGYWIASGGSWKYGARRNRLSYGPLREGATPSIVHGSARIFHVLRSSLLKVRSSVRPICEHCKVVTRRGVIRVICKRHPKQKQRQRSEERRVGKECRSGWAPDH